MEHAQGCEPAPSRAGLGWQEPLLRWALLLPHEPCLGVTNRSYHPTNPRSLPTSCLPDGVPVIWGLKKHPKPGEGFIYGRESFHHPPKLAFPAPEDQGSHPSSVLSSLS